MKTDDAIDIAVIGAGLVGARHAQNVFEHPSCNLAYIVDPDPSRDELAKRLNCIWVPTLDAVPNGNCDAAIVATPNADHLPSGIACLGRSWPTLIEKPIADTLENGEQLVNSFAKKDIPLLVGHHRRYHPVFDITRDTIATQKFGPPIMASIIWAVRKPDSYFDAGRWRLNKDGGPLMINFIHEADLLLGIFGPVAEVQATASNHARGASVEDTAGIIVHFQSGVIATIAITDAALTPWSFEGASGENPTIAQTGASSWRIGCTQGSFEFPELRTWRDAEDDEGNWSRQLTDETVKTGSVDPLKEQLSHFCALIRGEVKMPKVSGRDGLEALRLVEAVRQAATIRQPVRLHPPATNAKAFVA